MKVKDSSVNIIDLRPPITSQFQVIRDIFKDFHVDAVITSGVDGQHKIDSFHYKGLAIDLRTKSVLEELTKRLKDALGKEYDVIFEGDHIHIEYDPK